MFRFSDFSIMKTTKILLLALFLVCHGTMLTAATVVTEYQFAPNGNWFANPPQPPNPGAGDVSLIPLTDNPSHVPVGNMYNYRTTTPIANGAFGPFGPFGFAGPGLNLMLQNRNFALDGTGTSVDTLALRSQAGRLTMRTSAAEGGGGSSLLAWSTSANTSLSGVDFVLSIGPNSGSGGVADWEDGMRLAIQDTNDNWYLSNWASNGKVPLGSTDPAIPGTLSGIHLIDLTNETWSPFTPATSSSSSLVEFNAGSATFSAFAGQAKAFGFYVQDVQLELPGGATEFRMRMNGFQVLANPVAIPEPSSLLALGLGSCLLARRRRGG